MAIYIPSVSGLKILVKIKTIYILKENDIVQQIDNTKIGKWSID